MTTWSTPTTRPSISATPRYLGSSLCGTSSSRRLRNRRDELIQRYGRSFRTSYGWAVGLPGVQAGNFKEIEALAETDHRRGYYRWASHYIHGDSGSLRMSIMRRGGVSVGVVSGVTNVGLTDPVQLMLHSLETTYINAVFTPTLALADLYVAAGVARLVPQAGTAMWEGEQRVTAAEVQLHAEEQAEDRGAAAPPSA